MNASTNSSASPLRRYQDLRVHWRVLDSSASRARYAARTASRDRREYLQARADRLTQEAHEAFQAAEEARRGLQAQVEAIHSLLESGEDWAG